MTTFLSPDVLGRLGAARTDALELRCGSSRIPIKRVWERGLTVASEQSGQLPRGVVRICDDGRPLYQGLIVAVEDFEGERVFEFKRMSPVRDHAPVDFDAREAADY